jgi:hypothetical protein
MEKRFGAAVFTAVLLHAALLAFTALPRRSETPPVRSSGVESSPAEVELSILTEDGPSSLRNDRSSSIDEPSVRGSHHQPSIVRLRPPSHRSESAPGADDEPQRADMADQDAALAELATGAGTESSHEVALEPRSGVHQRVDLGLDGSILRRAALEARERAPRRRPVFTLGDWSESVVRSAMQKSAPREGRALLTLEWDSKGRLRSVTSSAASSSKDEWQRLANGLGSQLAARPNVSAQGTGLRLVYLVKSDLVMPESKRSLLPDAKYASAEQINTPDLPPAKTISLGVKADDSPATRRVVSIELVRSEVP